MVARRSPRWMIAMVLVAGCATGTPSLGSLPPATPGATLQPSPSPSATPMPAPTDPAGLPLAGTLAYNRNVVPGDFAGDYRIFTRPAAGGEATQLTEAEAEQSRWSNDGDRLSITGPGPQGLITAGFIDPDGTDLTWLDSPDTSLNLGCGVWSADALTFACEGWDDADPARNGLYTISAVDGSGLERITTAPPDSHDAPCDFTPDGSRLVFVRISMLAEEDGELMIVNLDGTGAARLLDEPVFLRCRLSPNGETLLVESDGRLLVGTTEGFPGVEPLPLALPPQARVRHPVWSPDGAHVAFSAWLPGHRFDLWVADANGDHAIQLTHTPDIDEELESWGR